MFGEWNQNVFFIQNDTLNFAEFEISEFEIARVDLYVNVKYSIYYHVTIVEFY